MNSEFDLLDAFQSPVITADSSWPIPQRVKDKVTMARFVAIAEKKQMATIPEVVAYLCTAANAAPLDSDWVDIFTHVSCLFEEKYYQQDVWDKVGAPRELTRNQQEDLMQLRQRIYHTRREILKKRLKAK